MGGSFMPWSRARILRDRAARALRRIKDTARMLHGVPGRGPVPVMRRTL
jgi:hypothetical protein